MKGEPSDVYLAGALKYTRGHVETTAFIGHHHVGLVGPIKLLIRTKVTPSHLYLTLTGIMEAFNVKQYWLP